MAQSEISGEAADALLEKAIQSDTSLRLNFSREGKILRYRSRLLGLSTRSARGKTRILGIPRRMREKVLVVERPLPEGHSVELVAGDPVEAYFVQGERYYAFHSAKLGVTQFQLNPDRRVPAIYMEYPPVVSHIQQREAFRVDISVLAPVSVRVRRAPELRDPLEEPEPRDEDLPSWEGLGGGGGGDLDQDEGVPEDWLDVEGSMLNLSLGGAAVRFRLAGGGEEDLKTGDEVLLDFDLPGFPVRDMHAVVRNTRLQETQGETEFKIIGVAFEPADLVVVQEPLSEFIMDRQRDILKKRK